MNWNIINALQSNNPSPPSIYLLEHIMPSSIIPALLAHVEDLVGISRLERNSRPLSNSWWGKVITGTNMMVSRWGFEQHIYLYLYED